MSEQELPTPTPEEQALKLYNDEGMTVNEVAIALRVSYGKAHRMILTAGGTMRPRGTRGKKLAPSEPVVTQE